MYSVIMNIDKGILDFVQNYIQSPFLDKVFPFISKLGNIGFIWIVISLILIASKKYRKAGILAILSIIIGSILGELFLKNLIARPRPYMENPNINLLIPKLSSYSFPSGHTTSSFASLGAYIRMIDNKKITIPITVFACLMAFSRIYLMVHYPTDILGGIILGLLSAKLASMYLEYKEKNRV